MASEYLINQTTNQPINQSTNLKKNFTIASRQGKAGQGKICLLDFLTFLPFWQTPPRES